MSELNIIFNERDKCHYISMDGHIVDVMDLRHLLENSSSFMELISKISKEFKGHKGGAYLSFDNKQDAENCLQWIESVLILNKLVGNEE